MKATPIITLDIDWAPDYAIDHAAKLLIDARVCATWFVTHNSPAVRRLRNHPDLFELGIHPNFLPGSTHGATEEEVITHCMQLVPEARVMRTHGLVQTSNLLQKVIESSPIAVDVSLFLPHARSLKPVVYYWGSSRKLVRVPYVWEDDFEMVRPDRDFDLGLLIDCWEGLMVLDFHPIHVFLNSIELDAYRQVRRLGPVASLREETVRNYVDHGKGTGYAFSQAIDRMRGLSGMRIADFQTRRG